MNTPPEDYELMRTVCRILGVAQNNVPHFEQLAKSLTEARDRHSGAGAGPAMTIEDVKDFIDNKRPLPGWAHAVFAAFVHAHWKA